MRFGTLGQFKRHDGNVVATVRVKPTDAATLPPLPPPDDRLTSRRTAPCCRVRDGKRCTLGRGYDRPVRPHRSRAEPVCHTRRAP